MPEILQLWHLQLRAKPTASRLRWHSPLAGFRCPIRRRRIPAMTPSPIRRCQQRRLHRLPDITAVGQLHRRKIINPQELRCVVAPPRSTLLQQLSCAKYCRNIFQKARLSPARKQPAISMGFWIAKQPLALLQRRWPFIPTQRTLPIGRK